MVHAAGLGLSMYILWLLLSGHYVALLLSLGAISCAFIVWIMHRMDTIDHESFPLHMTPRGLWYFPWLVWEIVKSNWSVAKIILAPSLPISPTMVTVKASQRTDVGRVTYANSITLTPGTLSVHMEGDEIVVHGITRDGAESLKDGDMDRRVSQLEGSVR